MKNIQINKVFEHDEDDDKCVSLWSRLFISSCSVSFCRHSETCEKQNEDIL
jgi:hypothetical protein